MKGEVQKGLFKKTFYFRLRGRFEGGPHWRGELIEVGGAFWGGDTLKTGAYQRGRLNEEENLLNRRAYWRGGVIEEGDLLKSGEGVLGRGIIKKGAYYREGNLLKRGTYLSRGLLWRGDALKRGELEGRTNLWKRRGIEDEGHWKGGLSEGGGNIVIRSFQKLIVGFNRISTAWLVNTIGWFCSQTLVNWISNATILEFKVYRTQYWDRTDMF